MSEIAEVVPKILKAILSKNLNSYEDFDFLIRPLENSRSFWSECYQVVVRLKTEKLQEEKISPLFVKIPKISEINAALDPENFEESSKILKALTEQEVKFYKDFSKFDFPNFPIPRFFYGESLENEEMAGLVCQDFSGISRSIDFVPGFSDDQVLKLMKALAGFHQKTLELKDEIPWEKYNNELYDKEYIEMLYNDTLQFETLFPAELKGRIQKIKHIFDIDGVKNGLLKNEEDGLPVVMCHNDLNASNILWNQETGDVQAFIDFQHVSKGPITSDIIRILCVGISVKQRRENTERYLRHYFSSFSTPPPFSFEQLLKSFWSQFNFVNATSLFSLFYYCKMYKETELEIKNGEKREEKAEEILRRTIGILEDIQ